MSEHYDFHYQPTGSGAISGQQVLEQTEDAINELGDYVNDNVGGAMDVAQQALETAQTAETNAQTALDTANSFSSAIQSAQQDASTALSTAQTAQTTASNANNTAIQAQQDASSAVTTANNASGQVSTLSGTVTALGQRVTTAEGNIGQNTSDITALGQRVGTAEGNITTLQNDVTIAQGNASSAMATAGQVKQQAFVFRYSSTALVASSTNSNSLLDNTDNLKVGDKVIDSSGVLFSITAIDIQNSTFTIGTALIDLATDSDVVHKSGDETVGGVKTFTDNNVIKTSSPKILLTNTSQTGNTPPSSNTASFFRFDGGTVNNFGGVQCEFLTTGENRLTNYVKDITAAKINNIQQRASSTTATTIFSTDSIVPATDSVTALGSGSKRWSSIYGVNYYYGSNNVEFSTKFVTTDTNQTISGSKTFSDTIVLQGTTTPTVKTISNIIQDSTSGNETISRVVKDKTNEHVVFSESVNKFSRRSVDYRLDVTAINNGTEYSGGVKIIVDPVNNTKSFASSGNNTVTLGYSGNRWRDVLTNKVNGVEPSSLSLPDLNNGIDISSYIDVSQVSTNYYTPPANGWISISVISSSRNSIQIESSSGLSSGAYACTNPNNTSEYIASIIVPCVKNDTVTIYFRSTANTSTIKYAKFFPCQGNV